MSLYEKTLRRVKETSATPSWVKKDVTSLRKKGVLIEEISDEIFAFFKAKKKPLKSKKTKQKSPLFYASNFENDTARVHIGFGVLGGIPSLDIEMPAPLWQELLAYLRGKKMLR